MKIKGQLNRPRLYVFKSNKHIYANIIDDYNSKILAGYSTLSREIQNNKKQFANCETAKIVGKQIGNKLKQLGIKQIVFDRGSRIYHGQIKALADATRGEGINF